MKRPFLFIVSRATGVVIAGTALIAVTYGLVRLAYGLFLPDIQADLGVDAAVAGFISSAASVGYCGGAIVGFFIAARHPRLLVAAAGASAVLGAAGMAGSNGVGMFAASAVAGSLGAGLASPGLVRLVGRNVAAAANDRSQAIVNSGTGPGLAAAGILALVLLPDWRLAWAVVAVIGVLATAAVLVLDHAGKAETTIGADAAAPDARTRPGLPSRSWFAHHARVIVAALLLGAGSAAGWNFGRTLIVEAGASDETSAVAWIAIGAGGAAVIGTARWLASRGPRAAWTITTLTVGASTAMLAVVPGALIPSLVAFAAFGWAYVAATGALIAWTTEIDPERAPSGTALLFVVLVFGQALGAAVLGVVAAGAGLVPAFIVGAVVTLAATVAAMRWRRAATPASAPTATRATG
ncbi:MFS transporter [Marisediminicola sp. LYQ134]|uniref:MFS transporter n=1 Tax=Marisediminicola sp. LYQ134 TaxID=3391061 RepID=UPI003983514A